MYLIHIDCSRRTRAARPNNMPRSSSVASLHIDRYTLVVCRGPTVSRFNVYGLAAALRCKCHTNASSSTLSNRYTWRSAGVRMRCAHKRLCHVKWFKTNRNYRTHTFCSRALSLPHAASNSFIYIYCFKSFFVSFILLSCRCRFCSIGCVSQNRCGSLSRRRHNFCVFPRQSWLRSQIAVCIHVRGTIDSLLWRRVPCRSDHIVPKTIEFDCDKNKMRDAFTCKLTLSISA